MKSIGLMLALLGAVAPVMAQDAAGVIPLVPEGMDDRPYDARDIGADGFPNWLTAQDRAKIAQQVAEHKARMAVLGPAVCADLTATPVRMPNGNMQYPVAACKKVDYITAPLPIAIAPLVKKGGKPEILPVEAVTNRSGLVASDAMQVGDSPENLRMIRIGELDARTGKPMNKELAGDIGYVRGFIAGQKVRMQQGNGSVKGFQGF